MFPLLLDDRVGAIDLAPLLGVDHQIARLDYGDVAFLGNGPNTILRVGIERKNMNDLFGSLYSGRLAGHQLIGLLDNYDIVYLVVEGNWRPNMHRGLVELADSQWHWHTLGWGKSAYTYRELVGRWNTLAVACGVIVAYTRDPQDTAAWVRFTYNWWQKDFSEHKSHRGFNRVNNLDRKVHFIKPTILRRMLKELPEVGWDLTEAIEAAYPTMELLVTATEKDLRSIPGVGKVIAHTIYRLLHEGG